MFSKKKTALGISSAGGSYAINHYYSGYPIILLRLLILLSSFIPMHGNTILPIFAHTKETAGFVAGRCVAVCCWVLKQDIEVNYLVIQKSEVDVFYPYIE